MIIHKETLVRIQCYPNWRSFLFVQKRSAKNSGKEAETKALERYCNCKADVLYCTHKINAFIFAFDMTWEGDDARCLHIEMSRRDHEIMPKF